MLSCFICLIFFILVLVHKLLGNHSKFIKDKFRLVIKCNENICFIYNTTKQRIQHKSSVKLDDEFDECSYSRFDWLFNLRVMTQTRLCVYPMLYESPMYRLASFKHARSELTANQVYFTHLSDAGFYYNPSSSRVTCQGCQNVLEISEFRSDPRDSRYHNTCCVYSLPNNAGSIRDSIEVIGTVHQTSTHQHESHEACASNLDLSERSLPGSRHESGAPTSETCEEKLCTAYEENGLRPTQTPGTTHQRTHPSYPMYLSFQKRLESFTAWTAKHVHTPNQLATAGFFYAGYADCVRCYQCGLGLKSWKPGDDIHLEHKKYRPTCPLLHP